MAPTYRKRYKKRRTRKEQLQMRILMIIIAVILLGSILGIIHKVKQERAQQTVSDSSWDITDKKYVDQRPELDVELLPVNEYSRPGLALKKVRGIVVHYTANPGTTAIQNRNYFAGLEQSHQTKASSAFPAMKSHMHPITETVIQSQSNAVFRMTPENSMTVRISH